MWVAIINQNGLLPHILCHQQVQPCALCLTAEAIHNPGNYIVAGPGWSRKCTMEDPPKSQCFAVFHCSNSTSIFWQISIGIDENLSNNLLFRSNQSDLATRMMKELASFLSGAPTAAAAAGHQSVKTVFASGIRFCKLYCNRHLCDCAKPL